MMNSQELADVRAALEGQLGRNARLSRHDRHARSPMNCVLDLAEQQLGHAIEVIWADNAAPSQFCLRGFSAPVIAFSTRYVEMWADTRSILSDRKFSAELKASLIEKHCLGLIAELSLQQDDPEFAAMSVLRASLIENGIVRVPNSIDALEHEEMGPGYMACWFYGLAHEIGHFAHLPDPAPQPFDTDGISAALRAAMSRFTVYPEEFRERVLAQAAAEPASLLGTDTLREECKADVFAADVLCQATAELMGARHQGSDPADDSRRFDILAFVAEMMIALNIVTIIDRCRRTAKLSARGAPPEQMAREAMLHPVALAARGQILRSYLQVYSARHLFGKVDAEQLAHIDDAFDGVVEGLSEWIDVFEKGLAQAMKFSLDRLRRPTALAQLVEWQAAVHGHKTGNLAAAHVVAFLDRARAMDKNAHVFDAMRRTAEKPDETAMPQVSGQNGFVCLWVEGPDGVNGPFGLPTRHGRVVFLFSPASKALFDAYRDASNGALDEGFEFKSYLIVAEEQHELREAVAKHLPIGTEFVLAVEGTEFFAQLFDEMGDGSIWSD